MRGGAGGGQSTWGIGSQLLGQTPVTSTDVLQYQHELDGGILQDPRGPIGWSGLWAINLDSMAPPAGETADIPASSIIAFNKMFPCREDKPDVCNGLSVICEEPPTPNMVSAMVKMVRGNSRSSFETQKV